MDMNVQQIFLHGLGQDPLSWEKVIIQMQPPWNSVCCNWASFVRGKEACYENLYAAFSELCEDYNETLDICGLSLGGVVALNYAIDHPERVKSLVLVAAQYKMPKALLRVQDVLFGLMPESMFKEVGLAKSEMRRLCATMRDLDFSASLFKVTCPVLVVCGDMDRANRRASEELADRLPNAELAIVPDVGHEINTDAPEEMVNLLRRFYGLNERVTSGQI